MQPHTAMLETIVQNLNVGTALIRGGDLRYQVINDAYQAIAPGREIVGKTVDEAWPESRPVFAERCRKVLETGEAYDATDECCEIQRAPGGAPCKTYFSWGMRRVQLPGDDGWGILISATDTTDRKSAEDSLQASREVLTSQREALELMVNDAPIDETLGILVRAARKHSGAGARAALFTTDGKGAHLRFAVADGMSDEYTRAVDGFVIGPNSPSCGTAAYTGKCVIVRNVNDNPLWRPYLDLARKHEFRACWSFPIRTSGGKVLGMLTLYHRDPCEPDAGAAQIIELLAQTAAMVLERNRINQEYRESQARLREAQRIARLGSWHWNATTDVTLGSDALLRIYGLDPASQTMPGFYEQKGRLYPPADWERLNNAVQNAIQTGAGYELDLQALRADGSRIWITARGEAVRASDGTIVGLQGTVQDITDRKSAEEALKGHEGLLRTATEHTHVGLVIVSPEHRYLYSNKAYAQVLSLPTHDIVGRHVEEMLPAVYQTQIRPRLQRAFSGERVQYELCLPGKPGAERKRDGVRFASVSYEPQSEYGVVKNVVVAVADITQRCETEEALRQSEQRFRAAAEAVSSLIWTNSADGMMEGSQPGWSAFTGQSYAEYQGYGWSKAVHPDDAQATIEAWERAVAGKRAFEFEHRVRRHDGEWRLCSIRALPVLNGNGEIREWVGVHTDITEQKRTEHFLVDADRRKDEFLATLAHELRNPLAPIRNSVRMLQLDGSQSAENYKAIVGIMDRQVTHMARLVDDLLDVSRISRGKITLRTERVDLSAVLSQAIETVDGFRESLGHELVVDAPPEPIYLDADAARLAQVVGNLLNNAYKFTERGGRIHLIAERVGSDAVITVRDNGIGIRKDQLGRVFDIFAQVETSLKRPGAGLGIGLSLVKNLVEMHGGTVEVRSAGVGEGSVFTVRLPVIIEAKSGPRQTARPMPAASEVRRRILIVDDNTDAARSLSMVLKLNGHETCLAHDGEEAVANAEAYRPDVILLDIGLPKMSGYDACRMIRQKCSGRKMTIMALTGWGQEEDRRKSKEAGFDAHLVKPVDFEELWKLLEGARAEGDAVS